MSVTNRLVYYTGDAASSSSIGSHTLAGNGTEITATGTALDVNIASSSGLGIFDEDAAHTTGDKGQHVLAVRQDTLAASVSADGDYGSLKLDSLGRLYVSANISNTEISVIQGSDSPWTVDAVNLDIRSLDHTSGGANDSVRLGDGTDLITSTLNGGKQALDVYIAGGDVDDDLANTAIENTATAVSTTAVNAVASALAGRKWLYLANEGNKLVYFGKTGVTTANGYPMYPGQQMEVRVGPSVAPQLIGATGASAEDIRVMELS